MSDPCAPGIAGGTVLPKTGIKFLKKGVDFAEISAIISFVAASVAHLVERHLAKVEVASSSLVTRSMRSIIKGFEKVC